MLIGYHHKTAIKRHKATTTDKTRTTREEREGKRGNAYTHAPGVHDELVVVGDAAVGEIIVPVGVVYYGYVRDTSYRL